MILCLLRGVVKKWRPGFLKLTPLFFMPCFRIIFYIIKYKSINTFNDNKYDYVCQVFIYKLIYKINGL